MEIKLLKDYTYGVDGRAKDVHMHKFVRKAANDTTLSDTWARSHENLDFRTCDSSLKPSNC